MQLRRLGWLVLVLGFLFAGVAKADTVTFNGSYSFASNGYGIPPYGGTLNGQSEQFYCVDFAHDITSGTSWNVTQSSLTGGVFTATRFGVQDPYLAMAWLVTQMLNTSDQTLLAEYQYAIWSLTGGPDPFGTNASLVAQAWAAVSAGFTGQGFVILTPTGTYGQEFLIRTPEPSVLLLMIIGMLAIAFLTRSRLFPR